MVHDAQALDRLGGQWIDADGGKRCAAVKGDKRAKYQ